MRYTLLLGAYIPSTKRLFSEERETRKSEKNTQKMKKVIIYH